MTPIFPATYSTLCPTALSKWISEKYGLRRVSCKLLLRGVGDTYLVKAADNRFIFRVYRSSHRSLQAIKDEVSLLLALKQATVSVSFPIGDGVGDYIQKIRAIEGERHGVLFSYAPGDSVRVMSESQLRIFGQEMARFHNVSTTIERGQDRWVFDLETTLYSPLKMLQIVFAENPDDHAWLMQAAKQVEDMLSRTDTSQFSSGYCHFDFLPKNFHFEGDVITFFDFDFMGYGWVVNDIMSFWQHLLLEVYTGKMTQEAADRAYQTFLDGYRLSRQLSEQELAVVPFLALGFWLFYMGFHTTHDQFYSYSKPSQLKAYTSLLRYLVANFWNKELIA